MPDRYFVADDLRRHITDTERMGDDLRALADLVDAEPEVRAALSGALTELSLFPHLFGLDADTVEAAIAPFATVTRIGDRREFGGHTFTLVTGALPAGQITLRVNREVTE